MTFTEIRDAIKACYRGAGVMTHNKKLDALNLHERFPEYFYQDGDKRLRERVFVHFPGNIPHKKHLIDELTEEQLG
jgi:hypothetical protein